MPDEEKLQQFKSLLKGKAAVEISALSEYAKYVFLFA